MLNEKPLMVSIQCMVFNHEPYLRQCLDGFVMQQTNFRFEAIVHDDVSSDGSIDIIREYAEKYPDIIKPIYEIENQYSKKDGSIERIMANACTGKYVAFCEGDDYWTDPLKLQKQVDFLENNPEYGVAYSAYSVVDIEGKPCAYKPSEDYMERSVSGDIFHELLKGNFPQTLTIVYRKNIMDGKSIPPYQYDYTMCLNLALNSKFKYFEESMGAYRINPNGMIQTKALDGIDYLDIQLFFIKEYITHPEYKRPHKSDKAIVDFLFNCCCGYNYMRKYSKYYNEIFKARPSLLLYIPKGLIEAQKRKRASQSSR